MCKLPVSTTHTIHPGAGLWLGSEPGFMLQRFVLTELHAMSILFILLHTINPRGQRDFSCVPYSWFPRGSCVDTRFAFLTIHFGVSFIVLIPVRMISLYFCIAYHRLLPSV
jgi:hypothetical protein